MVSSVLHYRYDLARKQGVAIATGFTHVQTTGLKHSLLWATLGKWNKKGWEGNGVIAAIT